jgi:outer membrane protein TolC
MRKLFLTFWLTLPGAASAEESLTLAEAVARAMANNPDLAVDTPAREAVESDLRASRADYWPSVDFEQSYTGSNNPVFVFGTLLSQGRFTAANFSLASLNRPDPIDNLQTRVQTQQTIFDFGRTRRRIQMAGIALETTDRDHNDHVRRVLFAVIDAYYSVSAASEALEGSQVALKSAEAIVNQARSRVEIGLAVEADLLRSQVFLASTRQREVQARGQLDVARALLNRLMGDPLDATPGRTATLTPVVGPLPNDGTLRAEQRQRRPDYQRMLAELQQAELAVGSRKAELLPTLRAFAAWEADNPSLTSAGGNNWTAGLSLRWNLSTAGRDAQLLESARRRLEQKRKELAALESAMALELHKALVDYRSAEQQVKVSRTSEAQSQESLRILRNRYDSGLATLTDVLSAETERAAARTALAEALYRHRLSLAQVEFAAGILSPTSAATQP